MTTRPMADVDIIAALRRQLDAAELRNAELARANEELQRQVEDLQRVLIGTAGDLIEEGRGDAFWAMAAHSANLRTNDFRPIRNVHVVGKGWSPPPRWCPLRKQDRLVTLRSR